MTRAAAAVLLSWLATAAGAVEDGARPPAGALSCSGCHARRAGPDDIVPAIAGRPAEEIAAAMAAFRSGERDGSVMGRISRGFTEDETRAIALWLERAR